MKKLMYGLEALLERGGLKKDIILLAVSGAALLLSLVKLDFLPFDPSWIAIVLCGVPIVCEALIGLITAFDIKADVLVATALIASVIIGEDFAAGEIAFIMQLGALLEDLTVARARAGIEKLVKLTPRTARVLRDGKEEIVPAEDVRVGETLRVLPGEVIPVDGVIVWGQTSIDQSVMTGESIPADKTEGDDVQSGTLNRFGAFDMRAEKVGEDSSLQRMIRLVQSADAGKAKIVSLADKWATWVVITAVTAAIITFLATHEILRAVTILVVFCPCALVLATPTAIMAAIGNASKHGLLVREGDALERLADVKKITFDKTGTLTVGTPRVVEAKSLSPDLTDEDLFALTASAETRSEHPLGKAIVTSFRQQIQKDPAACERFEMIPGQGVCACAGGRTVIAGNLTMMNSRGIACDTLPDAVNAHLENGAAVIYIAVDDALAGYIALADTLRENAAEVIRDIRAAGVEPVLLTGDNENACRHIAGKLDIRDYRSACLPEDKLTYITDSRDAGIKVCMVGDGINDAPALKTAHVGIAMGGIGSDIAVDAADIVLVNDDLREMPHLLALSRKMMRTIKLNLTFSMTLNFVAIVLAITGVLDPVAGALVHNCGSVLVIINSALLLRWKKR